MFENRMTIREVKSIGYKRVGVSCVYAFMDGDTPIYIGKKKNTKRRFESYISARSHNQALNDFISNNKEKAIVSILECENPERIESELIAKHSSTLVNIKQGSNRDWKKQSELTKPWVAGTGINCPTSIAMRAIKCKEKKLKVSEFLKSMSDHDRCLIEVEFAMKMDGKESVNKWISIVSGKMVNFLEVGNV